MLCCSDVLCSIIHQHACTNTVMPLSLRPASTLQKNMGGLPVSSSVWKKIGSHHSVLTTSKKLDRMKNSTTHPERGMPTGQTAAPRTGKTVRQIQGVLAYRSRDSPAETAAGTSAGVEKPKLYLIHFWRLYVDKSES